MLVLIDNKIRHFNDKIIKILTKFDSKILTFKSKTKFNTWTFEQHKLNWHKLTMQLFSRNDFSHCLWLFKTTVKLDQCRAFNLDAGLKTSYTHIKAKFGPTISRATEHDHNQRLTNWSSIDSIIQHQEMRRPLESVSYFDRFESSIERRLHCIEH